jgi:AAA15 family ATPase/GTPase
MKSIRIQNYKCFKDTGTIVLDPNMNVLVGKNNTGKTAYTEALSLRFTDDPHLSKETSTFRGTQPTGHSIVEVVFSFVLDEIYQLLLGRTWSFRRPNDINPQDYLSHVKDLFSSREIIFTAIYDDRRVINAYFPDLYHPKYGTGTAFKFDRNPNNIKIVEEKRSISSNSTPWDDFASLIRDQSVLLCSERFKQGQSPLRGDSKIKSDSSNLPDVLHTLATNEIKRFNKIKRLIKVIFPEVKNVSIPTIGDPKNLVKIHLDDNDSLNDRSDLCIPLQESGTGISQALSIIVAAVNTDFPRTIIIEDPQVFLHPSASRKLIHILRNETKNNQYIITTHSPIILNSSQPCTILKSSKYRRVGKINSFSSDSQIEVGDILREIGARPSDLFGADRILWVEGPTEQEI